MRHIRLFFSATSSDLGEHRQTLQQALSSPTVEVKVQEDFVDLGLPTLLMLDEYVAHCDAVIHVVGGHLGSTPPADSVQALRERYPHLDDELSWLDLEQPTFSYTQWEAYLAALHGRRLFLVTLGEGLAVDAPQAEVDAQQAHLLRLRQVDRHPVLVDTFEQLHAKVHTDLKVLLALHEPPVAHRVHVIAAAADRNRVRPHVQRLRAEGYQTVEWSTEIEGDSLTAEEQASIASAEEVLVFWSVTARGDPHVRAQLAFAREVAQQRGRAAGGGEGLLTGIALDDADLPSGLDPTPGRVAVPVWVALVMAVVAAGLAVHEGWDSARWSLLVAGLGLAAGAAWLQLLRRPDRMLRAARLYALGKWLDHAGVTELLAAAEGFLDRIFGERLISWRSLLISATISSVMILPVGYVFGLSGGVNAEGFDWSEAQAHGGRSLRYTVPLAIGNIVFDYLSLLITRSVLRRVVRRPRWPRQLLGLTLDASLVALCAAGAAMANLFMVRFILAGGGSWVEWPLAVLHTIGEVVTNRLDLPHAVTDPWASIVLVSAVAMTTATLPSLAHGSMLALGLSNRLAAHLPLRAAAEVLRVTASHPRGPWTGVVLVTTPLLCGLAWRDPWPLRWPGLPPPHEMTAGEWVRVEPQRCADAAPCLLGCPDDELGCKAHEARYEPTHLPQAFDMLRTEVTQELWASVWDRATGLGLDVMGLPRQPSVFVGRRRPVERVSWCDAARFANLWTLVEAERERRGHWRPVYSELESCEDGGEVTWDRTALGIRLPTEVEWELAARGGTATAYWTGQDFASVLGVDWVVARSGFRTHTVDELPAGDAAPAHPLGLLGIHGNVQEWAWDPWDGRPGAERHVDPPTTAPYRVIRGGGFADGPPYGRSAFRGGYAPGGRNSDRGFRLVRTPGDRSPDR
ncbi:MAG: SUMF1/EgtB/PvdO family nonheme iron enzyme [Myxococcota bacterium]